MALGIVVVSAFGACSSKSSHSSSGGAAGDASVEGGGTGGGAAGSGGSSGTGGSAGGGGDASTGLPLDQVASEIARVLCDNVAACYGAGVEIVTQGADCKQLFGDLFQDAYLAAIQKSVSDGTVTYDPALGAECIAQLEKANTEAGFKCLDVAKVAETCKLAMGKLGKAGAACAHSFECEANTYCEIGAACPGKCTPFLGKGGSCTDTAQCETGMTCFAPSNLEAGLPDPNAKPVGSCQPYVAKDEACDAGTTPACEPGAFCLDGICRPVVGLFTAQKGFTCGASGALCEKGLACEFQGLPLVSNGKCISDQPHSGCRLALPDGCGKDNYCSSGFLNIPGNCVALPAAGEACAQDAAQVLGLAPSCQVGLLCSQGACRKPKRIGEACLFDDECVSTKCKPDDPDAGVSDAGTPGKCAPLSC